MNRQQAFQEVFVSAFDDGKAWRDWFFNNVAVNDDEISVRLDGMGHPAGALLMQRYAFRYFGAELQSEYMSCVGTKPEARAKGVASQLITEALAEAAGRGTAVCELVPAQSHLYFFYRRFGFAGVFYVNRLRFTALHKFEGAGAPAEPTYELFNALESRLACGVVHSRRQYELVCEDIALDKGGVYAVGTPDSAAMVFAAPSGELVKVKSLLADDAALADGALALLRAAVGEKEIVVDMPPVSDSKAFLQPYGMMRIIDAGAVLGALAAAHPRLKYALRLRDRLLEANNGIFVVRDGKCVRREEFDGRLDLDVDIETLTSILFSSPSIASVFDLPSARPYMSLMLD